MTTRKHRTRLQGSRATEPRTRAIAVRVTEAEWAAIDQAAAKEARTVSDWARLALLELAARK